MVPVCLADIFIPSPDSLLVNLKESKDVSLYATFLLFDTLPPIVARRATPVIIAFQLVGLSLFSCACYMQRQH